MIEVSDHVGDAIAKLKATIEILKSRKQIDWALVGSLEYYQNELESFLSVDHGEAGFLALLK